MVPALKALVIAVFGISLALPSFAQQQTTQQPIPPEKRWERWIERLQKRLGLTSQQQEQLRDLLRQHWEQRQRERERFREHLKEILTPEQWQRLQQLHQEKRARIQERLRKHWQEKHHEPEGPPYR